MNPLIERLIYQGQPIPWEELDGPESKRLDQELGVVAGEMIDAGQLVRMYLCLAERRKYTADAIEQRIGGKE